MKIAFRALVGLWPLWVFILGAYLIMAGLSDRVVE